MVLMAATKSSFLDKVLGRIGRLDPEGLQAVVQRLARERGFLETLFNTIEDGVLVVDEQGRIVYFNLAVTNLLGRAVRYDLPVRASLQPSVPADRGSPRPPFRRAEDGGDCLRTLVRKR